MAVHVRLRPRWRQFLYDNVCIVGVTMLFLVASILTLICCDMRKRPISTAHELLVKSGRLWHHEYTYGSLQCIQTSRHFLTPVSACYIHFSNLICISLCHSCSHLVSTLQYVICVLISITTRSVAQCTMPAEKTCTVPCNPSFCTERRCWWKYRTQSPVRGMDCNEHREKMMKIAMLYATQVFVRRRTVIETRARAVT